MEGLGGAASVIAVIDISAKVVSLCYQYLNEVQVSRGDIERLQAEASAINTVLEEAQRLLDGADKNRLSASRRLDRPLKDCHAQLKDVKDRLEPGTTRKTMRRFGWRALKWPFKSKEMERVVGALGRCKGNICEALQIDQTNILLDIDQKIVLNKIPTASGASYDSHDNEHNVKCLEDTRVELLDKIKTWAETDSGKSIFWLNGMAGTGKSTIARTVAQSFHKRNQLAASFFFKKGEGDRGKAAKVFPTIASQLTKYIPQTLPGIRKAVEEEPNIPELMLKHQFECLVLRPLSDVQQAASPLIRIIVIDALDECDREEDIRTILHLLARAKDVKPISLRIFVTSRPELPIRLGFKQMADGTYQDLILHHVPQVIIEHDIGIFLKHEFQKIRSERELPQYWPGDENIRVLLEIAVPLFIFAATICRFVGEIGGNPRKRLEKMIRLRNNAEESKLDQIYRPVLEQIYRGNEDYDIQEFREIVGAIVVLANPLSVISLSNLLCITREDICCRLDSLHSVLSIPIDIKVPVRLLHLSFRDFLVDPQKRGTSLFWIDEEKVHERLATKCLELLSKSLKQDICNLHEPGILTSEIDNQIVENSIPPELQYACRYWVHHLEQNEAQQAVVDSVHGFLKQHILHWLEIMSLVGEVSEAIRMLVILQNWAMGYNNMTSFLYEAWLFALRYRHMMDQAPLQIYVSGLVFAPKQSIFQAEFRDSYPKWIKRAPEVKEVYSGVLATLEGHSSAVNAVTFSPDGKLVASGSWDRTVRLWDATTGQAKATLEGHLSNVSAVIFSPDSKLVVSSSLDKTIRLWDTATGQIKKTIEDHFYTVSAMAFSPDGKLLASNSGDSTVLLWDIATGQVEATLEGHSNVVNAVSFSPDGNLVASGAADSTIRLWDVATGQVKATFESPSNYVFAVAFSPDGRLVASGSRDSIIRLWDVATGKIKKTLRGHSQTISAVAFSPDGMLVASSSYDKTIRLWDATTGQVKTRLEGYDRGVPAIAFSPNGRLIASGSADIQLWDAATGQVKKTLEGHSHTVSAMIFSPNGKLVASGSLDNTVRLWNSATGQVTATLEGHSSDIKAVAFSPDGKLVASSSYDKTIRLWDVASGQAKTTLKGHSEFINDMVFSPDGKLVASGSMDQTIRLWDSATGQVTATLEGHSSAVRAVSFSPDGNLVASGSVDKTIRLWGAATGQIKQTLKGHSHTVSAVAFSPESNLVASVSFMAVWIWDAVTGQVKTRYSAGSSVQVVAFSPDGNLVATGTWNKTIEVWYAATGRVKTTIKDVIVSFIRFTSDGLFLDTDAGMLCLPSAMPISTTSPLPTSLSFRKPWVCDESGRKLLWIPPEYRPSRVAVQGHLFVGGCPSGRVWFLETSAT